MQYALLLYGTESAGVTPSAMPRETAEAWQAFEREARAAGVVLDWRALRPSTEARTLRLDAGTPIVTDGPFAETREQLGGFYLMECADLDEALRWAARMPCAPEGGVEVRPLLDGSVLPH